MRKKLIIGIDVDDVLLPCTELLMKEFNKRTGNSFTSSDVKQWGFKDFKEEERKIFFEILNEDTIYFQQKPFEDAQSFVREIAKNHTIVVCSAMYPHLMSIRGEQIKKYFPEIKSENIMLGSRKDLVHTDVLIDDNIENILKSKASFPICLDKSWNQREGVLRAKNYEEILKMIDEISNFEISSNTNSPKIICLLGSENSGKSIIANDLCCLPNYKKAEVFTTAKNSAMTQISKEDFMACLNNSEFIESSFFNGEMYGVKNKEIKQLLQKGVNPVLILDNAGALILKNMYPDKTLLVYSLNGHQDAISKICNLVVNTDNGAELIMREGR